MNAVRWLRSFPRKRAYGPHAASSLHHRLISLVPPAPGRMWLAGNATAPSASLKTAMELTADYTDCADGESWAGRGAKNTLTQRVNVALAASSCISASSVVSIPGYRVSFSHAYPVG